MPRITAILTSIENVFASIATVLAAIANVLEPVPAIGRPRPLIRERSRDRQKRECQGRYDNSVKFPHLRLRHRRCL